MELIVHARPPGQLLEIAKTELERAEVSKLIFTANAPLLQGKLGVFVPDTRSVIIDLGSCVHDTRWMEKGMFFLPNAWFNMLYAIYHEAAHARQTLEFEDWKEINEAILEHAADVEAIEKMYAWANEHKGNIPRLDEMGWAADEIRKCLNAMYCQLPETIDEEINVMGTGAVANAAVAIEASDALKDGDAERLNTVIMRQQEGIGLVISGKAYLKAEEFLAIEDQNGWYNRRDHEQ